MGQDPIPRPPAVVGGPSTQTVVKFESFYPRNPVSVHIEVRALTESDAAERLDAAYAMAVRQLRALATTPPAVHGE